MIIKLYDKPFEPHPEGDFVGVIVDVTSPKKIEDEYGTREVFSVVFETTAHRDDGRPYTISTRPMKVSIHEKSTFRATFLRQLNGRDLTPQELAQGYDTESLIGCTAKLTVVHQESNGKVYATIALIRPDRSNKPLNASGKYIRVKDREDKRDDRFPLGGEKEPDQVELDEENNADEENNDDDNEVKPQE